MNIHHGYITRYHLYYYHKCHHDVISFAVKISFYVHMSPLTLKIVTFEGFYQ